MTRAGTRATCLTGAILTVWTAAVCADCSATLVIIFPNCTQLIISVVWLAAAYMLSRFYLYYSLQRFEECVHVAGLGQSHDKCTHARQQTCRDYTCVLTCCALGLC